MLSPKAQANRDRHTYYKTLERAGDPYGKLALGVVDQSLISGRTARYFAEYIAKQWEKPLSPALWLKISHNLMNADYLARSRLKADDKVNNLSYRTIRYYHVSTFESLGIPGRAWTAFIPLEIAGVAGAAGLWADMLRRNIFSVGLETVSNVLEPIARQAQLKIPVPGTTDTLLYDGTAYAGAVAGTFLGTLIRDMLNPTTVQRCKDTVEALRCIAKSTEQEDAVLWLDGLCYATAPTSWDTFSATTTTNWRGTMRSIERQISGW